MIVARVVAWCVAIALVGCGHDDGSAPPSIVASAGNVGGTITGIAAGNRVVLTNAGADALVLTFDGGFTFPARVADSGRFDVAVASASTGQACVVLFGSGPVSNAVAARAVRVSCGPSERRAFAATGDLQVARMNHRVVKLDDGTIFAFGGGTPVIERYDSKTGVWAAAGMLPTGLSVTGAAVVGPTKVLVAAAASDATPVAFLYDTGTHTVSPTPPFNTLFAAPQLVGLRDGRVLAVDTSSGALANAELYDPGANRWSLAASVQSGVSRHLNGALVLMADGNVLYASGFGQGTQVGTTEIYDAATGTWTPGANNLVPREDGLPVLLPDGRILLAGGVSGRASANSGTGPFFVPQVEIYDPSSRQWALAGVIATQRIHATATLIPTGEVLIAGGNTGQTNAPGGGPVVVASIASASVDVYDPRSNTLTPWGAMTAPRTGHAAILTQEGRLLVAGGELFTSVPFTFDGGTFQNVTATIEKSSELGF